MKYLKLYENFNEKDAIYTGIFNALFNNNRKLFNGIKSQYNLDLDFDNIDYFQLIQDSNNVDFVDFLENIIKQKGEIYTMPYRISEGKAVVYTMRGKPTIYYITDKIPDPLTPDQGLTSDEKDWVLDGDTWKWEGGTWTWDENDLTVGDVKLRKIDQEENHNQKDKWDRPLPTPIKDVKKSLKAEKSWRTDKMVLLDDNYQPIWGLIPDEYREELKKSYEKNK